MSQERNSIRDVVAQKINNRIQNLTTDQVANELGIVIVDEKSPFIPQFRKMLLNDQLAILAYTNEKDFPPLFSSVFHWGERIRQPKIREFVYITKEHHGRQKNI